MLDDEVVPVIVMKFLNGFDEQEVTSELEPVASKMMSKGPCAAAAPPSVDCDELTYVSADLVDERAVEVRRLAPRGRCRGLATRACPGQPSASVLLARNIEREPGAIKVPGFISQVELVLVERTHPRVNRAARRTQSILKAAGLFRRRRALGRPASQDHVGNARSSGSAQSDSNAVV